MNNHIRFCHTNILLPCNVTCDMQIIKILPKRKRKWWKKQSRQKIGGKSNLEVQRHLVRFSLKEQRSTQSKIECIKLQLISSCCDLIFQILDWSGDSQSYSCSNQDVETHTLSSLLQEQIGKQMTGIHAFAVRQISANILGGWESNILLNMSETINNQTIFQYVDEPFGIRNTNISFDSLLCHRLLCKPDCPFSLKNVIFVSVILKTLYWW